MFHNWYKVSSESGIDFNDPEFQKEIQDVKEQGPVAQYLSIMKLIRDRSHSKLEGYHYNSPEALILKEGIKFESQPLTPEEMEFLKKIAKTTGHYRMKECFFNAQSLAQKTSKIKYVEGYVYNNTIPLEHAWNSLNGKVLDFTLKHTNGGNPILGIIPEGWEYYGLPIETRAIRRYWAQHGMSEPLISNWREEYPLLKNPYKRPI